jgi:hypothetical protein
VVESNNGEERLARIENILETLQREAATLKTTKARILHVAPAVPVAPVTTGSGSGVRHHA